MQPEQIKVIAAARAVNRMLKAAAFLGNPVDWEIAKELGTALIQLDQAKGLQLVEAPQ